MERGVKGQTPGMVRNESPAPTVELVGKQCPYNPGEM
jgi:hypothetical protein